MLRRSPLSILGIQGRCQNRTPKGWVLSPMPPPVLDRPDPRLFSPATGLQGRGQGYCQLPAQRDGSWELQQSGGLGEGELKTTHPPTPSPTAATGSLSSLSWELVVVMALARVEAAPILTSPVLTGLGSAAPSSLGMALVTVGDAPTLASATTSSMSWKPAAMKEGWTEGGGELSHSPTLSPSRMIGKSEFPIILPGPQARPWNQIWTS